MAVILLLFIGLAGHSLYRYTWLWFGAFQAIGLMFFGKAREELLESLPQPTAGVLEFPAHGVIGAANGRASCA